MSQFSIKFWPDHDDEAVPYAAFLIVRHGKAFGSIYPRRKIRNGTFFYVPSVEIWFHQVLHKVDVEVSIILPIISVLYTLSFDPCTHQFIWNCRVLNFNTPFCSYVLLRDETRRKWKRSAILILINSVCFLYRIKPKLCFHSLLLIVE